MDYLLNHFNYIFLLRFILCNHWLLSPFFFISLSCLNSLGYQYHCVSYWDYKSAKWYLVKFQQVQKSRIQSHVLIYWIRASTDFWCFQFHSNHHYLYWRFEIDAKHLEKEGILLTLAQKDCDNSQYLVKINYVDSNWIHYEFHCVDSLRWTCMVDEIAH